MPADHSAIPLDTRLAFDETPLKYVAEQKGTYEYPDVQNVFPSLPQQFMHPSIHHDHAVKRMLYPKPKVLMMFRLPLQSFTCPPSLQCYRMTHVRMPQQKSLRRLPREWLFMRPGSPLKSANVRDSLRLGWHWRSGRGKEQKLLSQPLLLFLSLVVRQHHAEVTVTVTVIVTMTVIVTVTPIVSAPVALTVAVTVTVTVNKNPGAPAKKTKNCFLEYAMVCIECFK
mmetsp:Transcript_870/g.1562  ORF Transcript_870/g.1562 Transcript_870/m.1562 type:complete len:226 (+) Transcript_870:359-1036(+)